MTPRREGEPHDCVSVKHALRTSLAENTRRAYRSGWSKFAGWCSRRRLDPMAATPEDIAEFLVTVSPGRSQPVAGTEEERPLALGTIRICLAAINRRYGDRELESRRATARSRACYGALDGWPASGPDR